MKLILKLEKENPTYKHSTLKFGFGSGLMEANANRATLACMKSCCCIVAVVGNLLETCCFNFRQTHKRQINSVLLLMYVCAGQR